MTFKSKNRPRSGKRAPGSIPRKTGDFVIGNLSRTSKADVRLISVRVNGAALHFRGRYAWTLLRLIEAGDQGCTPIERPAPRWAHYIFWLRRNGISIETITEKHGGAYAGTHARYVLRSRVEVIELREAA